MTAHRSSSGARLAAANNAEWCDAVCRSHGHPGTFRDAYWIARHRPPPMYPDLVTLTPDAEDEQLAAIAELARSRSQCAVKDSFDRLDLAPLGFTRLGRADWIVRSAERPLADLATNAARWTCITSADELVLWDTAWSGNSEPSGIFLPTLLDDPTSCLIAGWADGQVIAGAALNRSHGAAGWSNVFAPHADHRYRGGALALAVALADGVPLVGYESGDALDQSIEIGFQPVGGLSVWVR